MVKVTNNGLAPLKDLSETTQQIIFQAWVLNKLESYEGSEWVIPENVCQPLSMDGIYRTKPTPKMITINGCEVEPPLMVEPEIGEWCWCIDTHVDDGVNDYRFQADPIDLRILHNHNCFASKKAALAMREALWKPLVEAMKDDLLVLG